MIGVRWDASCEGITQIDQDRRAHPPTTQASPVKPRFERRRSAADLLEHLARGAHDLVDGLDHVHRNADGARLVGDRACDRLPDPPSGIGRKLVAAAILELIDRLHQPDIAFLDQVEELQAAVGVFVGNRSFNHEQQSFPQLQLWLGIGG